MRILMVADGHGGNTHEKAYGKAFERMGHEVHYFTWKEYFKHYPYANHYPTDGNILKSIFYRFQNKAKMGPAMFSLNRDLVKLCQQNKFDLVFVYRGTHIYPRTIQKIKRTGAKVFGYNNDDPFSQVYRPYFWRHFRACVPFYDHIFYYRLKNKADYDSLGVKNVSLLRASFIESRNFKMDQKSLEDSPYNCDVIFIGHFEKDGRDKMVLNLLEKGFNLELYGTNWQQSPYYDQLTKTLGHEVYGLYGEDYNKALNSAKVALVFLSKINNDTYTRRCFEIPAAGTCMLAEYSDDLAHNLYQEGVEALYFKNEDELQLKLKQLLTDDDLRQEIADAAHGRVWHDKHEVYNRAEEVMNVYQRCVDHG
ncbi:MAG: glycosyltransferase [Pseudomonadota bacterium]|nr:glycosyltransferase [Pseudomonadota bacterium]